MTAARQHSADVDLPTICIFVSRLRGKIQSYRDWGFGARGVLQRDRVRQMRRPAPWLCRPAATQILPCRRPRQAQTRQAI